MTYEKPQPHAGFARADITPDCGTQLAGAVGEHRPATEVLDPLHATALVLESGPDKICILALDVTVITARHTEAIRDRVADTCDLEPQSVMVHATQTHSAPAIGHFMLHDDFPEPGDGLEWIRGAEAAYSQFAVERAAEAIHKADGALQRAEIGAGSAAEGRPAHNRRAIQRDGSVTMPGRNWPEPLGPTNILYIEGPIDPELGVIAVRSAAGKISGAVVNYTCHPVHVFPRPVVSADWPGATAAEFANAHDNCTCMVLNGACGNINPWPAFEPEYDNDHRRMGAMLADRAAEVLPTIQYSDVAPLDARITQLQIPLRDVPKQRLQWAEQILEDNPGPVWDDDDHTSVNRDWMVAASVYSVQLLRERCTHLEYELQLLRMGDTAIVGLPGEPFSELGLQIKLASPAKRTYIAHCTSH